MSITRNVFAETIMAGIDPIGVTTINYGIGNDLEIEAKKAMVSGDTTMVDALIKHCQEFLNIFKGDNKEYKMYSKETIDTDSGLKIYTIEKLNKNSKEVLLSNMKDAKPTLENIIKVGIDIQNLGRQAQEGDIDAYKTFELLEKVFNTKTLSGIKNRIKSRENLLLKHEWNEKDIHVEGEMKSHYVATETNVTCFYDNSMAQDIDDAMKVVVEECKELLEKKQKIGRLNGIARNRVKDIPEEVVRLVRFLQGQYMTLSTARSKMKSELRKTLKGELDKVAREAVNNKFNDFFSALRNTMRFVLTSHGYIGVDACLTGIKICADSCDTLEDENSSDVVSSVVDRILTDELLLSSINKSKTTKNKLVECTFEDGEVVEFKMGYSIKEDRYAVGDFNQIPDGIYTIRKIDDKFYACKNIHESILANMEEEINQKHFLVRVKANGVFDLPSLLDKEVKLRGYVRVNGKDCRQIVAVGNKIIGEYAIPFIDKKDFSSIKEQKDMVDKVKAPFEGDYICERAETFITYHDGIKDPQIFLVLKSK